MDIESWRWIIIIRQKHLILHSTYSRAEFAGTPTADSRFAVPRPSNRNALRNPPRQHVPTVSFNARVSLQELNDEK